MNDRDYVVRRARPADAVRLGEIHVLAWRAAYVGVMTDDYLAGMSMDERAEMWARTIVAPRPGQVVQVVQDDGRVQGFATFGPEDADPDKVEVGEIFGINLDPAAWGRGLGRRLLVSCTDVCGLRAIGRPCCGLYPRTSVPEVSTNRKAGTQTEPSARTWSSEPGSWTSGIGSNSLLDLQLPARWPR